METPIPLGISAERLSLLSRDDNGIGEPDLILEVNPKDYYSASLYLSPEEAISLGKLLVVEGTRIKAA